MVREGKPVPSTLLPMLLEQICTIDVISLFVKLNPYPPRGGVGGRRSYVLKTLSQEILST